MAAPGLEAALLEAWAEEGAGLMAAGLARTAAEVVPGLRLAPLAAFRITLRTLPESLPCLFSSLEVPKHANPVIARSQVRRRYSIRAMHDQFEELEC